MHAILPQGHISSLLVPLFSHCHHSCCAVASLPLTTPDRWNLLTPARSRLLTSTTSCRSIPSFQLRWLLLVAGGYECQEAEGTFMVAFAVADAAIEWSLMVQRVLMDMNWPER